MRQFLLHRWDTADLRKDRVTSEHGGEGGTLPLQDPGPLANEARGLFVCAARHLLTLTAVPARSKVEGNETISLWKAPGGMKHFGLHGHARPAYAGAFSARGNRALLWANGKTEELVSD